MVGKVGDVAQALATLQDEQARLLGLLQREPVWHALGQLDARESGGDPVAAIDSQALREQLAARLDVAVPAWRALAGIETAISVLSGTPVARPAGPPAAFREPVTLQEQPAPPVASAKVPERPTHRSPPIPGGGLADPIAGSAAAERNRSLARAIGSMQALGAAEAAMPPDLQPVRGDDLDARAVLGRIRSVDGEQRAVPAEPDLVRAEPAAVNMAPGAIRVHAGRQPASAPQPAGHPDLPPPPPAAIPPVAPVAQPVAPVAVGPQAPAPSSSSVALAADGNLDSAARVAALEQELDRLMRRHDDARQSPPPSVNAYAAASASGAEAFDNPLDEIFLEEAEIEIVSLEAGSGADDEGGRRAWEDLDDDDDGGDRLGPLSTQLLRSQARQAAEAENHAAYHGIIDEASVEIVKLDEPRSGTAPASAKEAARRPPLQLARDK